MSKVGRSGGSGGPKGTQGASGGQGASGASGPNKAEGAKGFGTVDRMEPMPKTAGLAGVAGVPATDPLTPGMMETMRAYKAGEISREQAFKSVIAQVLEKKLRLKSKALTQKIYEQAENQEEPLLLERFERLARKG